MAKASVEPIATMMTPKAINVRTTLTTMSNRRSALRCLINSMVNCSTEKGRLRFLNTGLCAKSSTFRLCVWVVVCFDVVSEAAPEAPKRIFFLDLLIDELSNMVLWKSWLPVDLKFVIKLDHFKSVFCLIVAWHFIISHCHCTQIKAIIFSFWKF